MNKEEIIEMLHDIAQTISGFDGTIKGLLKINDYIMKVKENTTTENSDDSVVCIVCGKKNDKYIRKGETIRFKTNYCSNCGKKFNQNAQ